MTGKTGGRASRERLETLAEVLGYTEFRCLIVAAVGGRPMDPFEVVRVAVRQASVARALPSSNEGLHRFLRCRVRDITCIEMRAAKAQAVVPPEWARSYLFARGHVTELDETAHLSAMEFGLSLVGAGVFDAAHKLSTLIERERERAASAAAIPVEIASDTTPPLRRRPA